MTAVFEEIPLPSKSTPVRKHLRDFFSQADPEKGERRQVIDVAVVRTGDEFYLAVEETAASRERRVRAIICLPVKDAEGSVKSYRPVEEGDAAAPSDCPLRILYLLTPTKERPALSWRLGCYRKQIEEARRLYEETKKRYAPSDSDFSRYIRKSVEAMVERRSLILHQALSAEQTTRSLLEALSERPGSNQP